MDARSGDLMATSLQLLLSNPTLGPSFPRLGWNSCRRFSGISALSQESKPNGASARRIWRRRKLTKRDEKLKYKLERIPFLEEQMRKLRESGEIMSLDIEKLMLSEENRFDFVNEIAEEAKSYVEKNSDEYGAKKPILHVLSNRMNDAGFYRPEAYMEPDPFSPGPGYIKALDL